ncbi:MAG: lytic murein transglycosylase B [Gammaproteobacteria bacterium]|nr:lytic murein transglycosylase B [Gammaproteobacteria bacterium]
MLPLITRFCACIVLLVAAFTAALAEPYDAARPAVAEFVEEMVEKHGMNRAWLNSLLGEARYQQSIIDAISRPAEKTLEWHEYRKIFVNAKRINAGVKFWQDQRETLSAIAGQTGVPEHIIVAIIGVETYYGRIKGSYRVIDSLATLAFDYPPRSKFFRSELEEFLLLAQEEQLDPLVPKGSYAGAMGSPQFISSSFRNYAVDGSGDGRRDLWDDWQDIIASVANYFTRHGWRAGEPVAARVAPPGSSGLELLNERADLNTTILELRNRGVGLHTPLDNGQPAMLFKLTAESGPEYWVGFRNYYVITRYNRSLMYAMAVKQLGEKIAEQMEETVALN